MTERDFRSAFDDHKGAVYNFALRLTGSAATAEDLAQDCFLLLLRHPGRFDASRGTLRAFLLGVVRKLAMRRWREEQRLEPLDDDPRTEAPGDIGLLVGAAVRSLPPLQREAVLLFEYEGFTLEEIARTVEADVGTVKSRLHRARERLRHLLAPLRTR
jgi:RNA polymerase sigma-70 factor (ECF subfamily)